MDDLNISALWTVSAVVFGFQSAALSWRITREIDMEGRGERTWTTASDGIVLMSALILIGGVFLAPVLAGISIVSAAKWFGLSVVLFASAPVVMAGHYNLFRHHEGYRDRLTTQEKWSLTFPVVLSVAYGIAWWQL